MTYVQRHTVAITTDASGDGTGLTPNVTGRIINVIYTKDGTTPYDAGVDVTVILEASGQAVWTGTDVNASVTIAPRQATHDTVGAASLYASTGEPVEDYIFVAFERVKIVVASGGNTKDGSFTVTVA